MKKYLVVVPLMVGLLAGCAKDKAGPGAGVQEGAQGTDQASTQASGVDQANVQGQAITDPGAAGQQAAAVDAKRLVYFPYDSASVDDEGRGIIETHARYLKSNPGKQVRLEGHADERGTPEYNLALGERRAQSVERMLRLLGVDGNRIATRSWGEEKPASFGHDESAWRQNRRVEIIYQ